MIFRSATFGLVTLGCAWVLGSSGCIGSNGDDLAPKVRYESDDKAFGFDYVDPPWSVDEQDGESIRLEIPTEVFGVKIEGSPPTHLMVAHHADLKETLEQFASLTGTDVEDIIGTNTGIVDWSGWSSLEDYTGWEDWTGWTEYTGWTFTAAPSPDELQEFVDEDLEDLNIPGLPNIPAYLLDVNLKSPREVAFAELSYLTDQQDARIQRGVEIFETNSGLRGVSYEVALDPGIFIRSFYFPTSRTALKVMYISLFELDTLDVNMMAASVYTDAPNQMMVLDDEVEE